VLETLNFNCWLFIVFYWPDCYENILMNCLQNRVLRWNWRCKNPEQCGRALLNKLSILGEMRNVSY